MTCIDCRSGNTELFRDESGKWQKRCLDCGYESSWGEPTGNGGEAAQATLEAF